MNNCDKPLLILALTLLTLAIVGYPAASIKAASFDCKQAKTWIEKTTCRNTLLDQLDSQLGSIYKEMMNSERWDRREELKEEQRAWLKSRAANCSKNDAKCLQTLYRQRIVQFNRQMFSKIESFRSEAVEIETITKKISPVRPPIEFRIYWSEQPEASPGWGARRGEISMIEINDTEPKKILQRVINPSNGTSLFFGDYNFDRYLDFRITGPGMVLGNVHADVFTFDPASNRYARHQQLSELTSITVESKQRRIYSINRSSAGLSFTYKVLTFSADNLVILLKRTSAPLLENDEIYLEIKEEKFDSNGRQISIWTKKIKADDLKDDHFPLETIPPDKLP